MRDAITLLWAYLFGAADFASLPARVSPRPGTAEDADSRPTGRRSAKQVISADQKNGRLLWLTGEREDRLLGPAKLDVFTRVVNVAVKHRLAGQ